MPVNRFIYPRTIAVRRPRTTRSAGLQAGYSGNQRADEDPIATGLPASIQASKSFRATGGEVSQASSPGPGRWLIYIHQSSAARGTIRKNDVVEDDLGIRYLVADDYWSPMGYRLQAVALEA